MCLVVYFGQLFEHFKHTYIDFHTFSPIRILKMLKQYYSNSSTKHPLQKPYFSTTILKTIHNYRGDKCKINKIYKPNNCEKCVGVGGITRDKHSIQKSKGGLGKLHRSSQTSLNFPYI